MGVLRWIPWQVNITDALTKNNFVLYKLLDGISSTVEPEIDLVEGKTLDSNDWQ